MNLTRVIGAIVGGVAGYLIVRSVQSKTREATIAIERVGDRFVSTTSPKSLRVRELESPLWQIDEPPGGLGDASVELRFVEDDSPLFKKRPKDKKVGGKRKIRDIVRPGTKRPEPYKYEVWYVSKETEYRMEDPDIIVF